VSFTLTRKNGDLTQKKNGDLLPSRGDSTGTTWDVTRKISSACNGIAKNPKVSNVPSGELT